MAPIEHFDGHVGPPQIAEAERLLIDYRHRTAKRVPFYFVLVVLGAIMVGVSMVEMFHEFGSRRTPIGALTLLLTGIFSLGCGSILLLRNAAKIRQLELMVSRLVARRQR